MIRVHVDTGAQLEFRTKVSAAIQGLLTAVFFAPLALIAGCSGVVSNSSPSTPPPQGQIYSVSGTISPTTGGSGATVALSGAASATATANSSGAYTFTGLAKGTYAVTPSRTGYTFNPTSQSTTVNGANVTGINFTATPAQTHTATASWTASTSAVSGYNVYRGTVSGGPYTKLNGPLIMLLTYTDTTVLSGQTYFFVTTSVDGGGNESVFSNEVGAVVP
ncbi:MAG TPA: SdrD B-like domain-containing protein [Candidatus Acidoferrum sp.]|nr:SdrD B-like domain-containing protein [Candidatus Acidoferrum sp.]